MKINLFLSYKERTRHNVVIFSKILPNNQIITACYFELQVQEMTMNEKITMIGLNWLNFINRLYLLSKLFSEMYLLFCAEAFDDVMKFENVEF